MRKKDSTQNFELMQKIVALATGTINYLLIYFSFYAIKFIKMKLLALIIGAALYCTNAIRIEAPKFHLKKNEVNPPAASSSKKTSDTDSDSSFGLTGLYDERGSTTSTSSPSPSPNSSQGSSGSKSNSKTSSAWKTLIDQQKISLHSIYPFLSENLSVPEHSETFLGNQIHRKKN